jgi:hypothetical protein
LLSSLVRCGRPLARSRDHSFGIRADLLELRAQLLHRLLGRLARGRALGSPLLGACLRSVCPLARSRDLGFGVGAHLIKLGPQALHGLFVRLGCGRTLGSSFKVAFGDLLLCSAGRSARLVGDAR